MEATYAETTRLCLQDALQGMGHESGFITATHLQRPTFPFLRAIIALFCEHLSFAEGLYESKDETNAEPTSRKEKIGFLVKILGVVSILAGERFDIYISPASVLSGQDVEATHTFLRALASRASRVPPEQSKEAAAQVLDIGETTLYRRGVRTRNTIVTIQAVWRGRLVRQKGGGGGSGVGPINVESPAVVLDISDDELSSSEEDNLGDEGSSVQREAAVQDACSSDNEAEKTQLESEQPESSPTLSPESVDREIPSTSPTSPTSPIISSPLVYVGLDGQKKVAAKEKASETGTDGSSSSSAAAKDTEPRFPQHQQAPADPPEPPAPKQKKSSLPKRSVPARIRSDRPRSKVDAYTSVQFDNAELMRDMSELHVKQLQHREVVEVFRKAEVNLKVRVQRITEKESELKRKEIELREKEKRVTRVSENLRKEQQRIRQKQDAIKAETNGRPLGSIAVTKANEESKPPVDPSIAAEIKGLRRKLFRSERRVQKREDQIRSLCRRLGRLRKAHQRFVEEAKTTGLDEESDRSSWLIERSTNSTKSARANHQKIKIPPIDRNKKRVHVLPVAREVPGEKVVGTVEETSQQQHPRAGSISKPSVSFSPNVKVTRLPAPPSSVDTPTRRTRRAAYVQQAKAEIVPLSSEKIRQSLSEES